MTKKSSDQNMSYREELLNSIEPNFIFSKKPINRFKIQKTQNKNKNLNKNVEIIELKKVINSIQNCNLKNNSKNLILGDGNIDSPIMIVGEAPGAEEEKTGKTFQGEVGTLLNKMFLAINLNKKSNLVELNARLKKIDLIESIYIQEFNNKTVKLKIKYLGKLDKIKRELENQKINLRLIGDQWSIKII